MILEEQDYDWSNRSAKRHADVIGNRCIAKWVRSKLDDGVLSVLSLPACEWIWEREFSSYFPGGAIDFHGIERDPKVYTKMCDIGKRQLYGDHRLLPEGNVSFAEFAAAFPGSGRSPYDLIYLDWLGYWGEDKYQQIEMMFENDMLTSDSMFRFTCALSRGKAEKWEDLWDHEFCSFAIADIRGGGDPIPDWKVYGIPSFAVEIGRRFGRKVKPIALQMYHSHGPQSTTPMGNFLFRIK